MKKLTIILSVIGLLLSVVPMSANAAEMVQKAESTNQSLYGTVTVMETNGWEDKPDGGKYITQVYYVTKTVGGYVYLMLNETNNVKITSILPSSNFEKVKETRVESGVQVLLKAKSTVSSKTEAMTVLADIVDPSKQECVLNFSFLKTNCINIDDLYFDKNGNLVTQAQFKEICEGVNPDDPLDPDDPNTPDNPENPKTGDAVPYVAVAGGLIAIAGVYFYSRKSNKMYKI